MSSIDTEYFRERALVEHQLADYATNQPAGDAHRQMAEAYEALVERFENGPTLALVPANTLGEHAALPLSRAACKSSRAHNRWPPV